MGLGDDGIHHQQATLSESHTHVDGVVGFFILSPNIRCLSWESIIDAADDASIRTFSDRCLEFNANL
jgi:hypothetical protein